jgi:hypothetical protein
MKKLNEKSTRIFCRLLDKLKQEEYIRLTSEGYMPLTIERIGENINMAEGVATQYSLCHYYTQNGDLMRDPEMGFLVVDNRTKPNEYSLISIYPQFYQLDNEAYYEESISIEGGQVTNYIKAWHDTHCSFANLWLQNIQAQGFIK